MTQLTLIPEVGERTLAGEIDRLCADAHARALGASDIRAASSATRARFESWFGRDLEAGERARVRSYFSAVLRRRVLTSHEPSTVAARRRLVAASIEADLRAGGWSDRRAAQEALRLTGQAS